MASPRAPSQLLWGSLAEWGSPCPLRFYPQPDSGAADMDFHGGLAAELTQGGGVQQAVPVPRGGQRKEAFAARAHGGPPVQATWNGSSL